MFWGMVLVQYGCLPLQSLSSHACRWFRRQPDSHTIQRMVSTCELLRLAGRRIWE